MFKLLDLLFPGKARLKSELAQANKEILPLSENLVDWVENELELMSLIQENRKIKSSFEKSASGIVCSIYHEHMAAYIWKKIIGFGVGDLEIMLIKTKKYKYEYVIKNGKASFYVNDQFLGEFRKDNRLYISKSKAIAMLDIDSSEWWDIHYGNANVGALVNIEKAREVNPRAFRLRRNLVEDAEIVFLSIALYKIVLETKDMKKLPFR